MLDTCTVYSSALGAEEIHLFFSLQSLRWSIARGGIEKGDPVVFPTVVYVFEQTHDDFLLPKEAILQSLHLWFLAFAGRLTDDLPAR